jgi:hypothetical protein
MKTVTSAQWQKAAAFLKNEAHPLEGALYAWFFEGGPAERVWTELALFQNTDGGFGHGLEADIRLPGSSVIATTVAFQWLRQLDTPAEHPLVVNGCRYLREQYHADHLNWPIIPPHIDDAPHAPWWQYNGELMEQQINPRVEILGYVYDYAAHFPAVMREQLTGSVVTHLLSQPDEMEMHDLLCCLRLLETQSLSEAVREPLLEKLTAVVSHTVERNPDTWRGYGLPPLGVIKSPESLFAGLFTEVIPLNLDFLIEQQGADGTWGPAWSWGDVSPEAWAQAEREWRGTLTLGHLLVLKVFGRAGNLC